MVASVLKCSPKSSKAPKLNFRAPMDVKNSPIGTFSPSLATPVLSGLKVELDRLYNMKDDTRLTNNGKIIVLCLVVSIRGNKRADAALSLPVTTMKLPAHESLVSLNSV